MKSQFYIFIIFLVGIMTIQHAEKRLEIGSGARRFTKVILRSQIELFLVNYSNPVVANW